MGMMPDQFWSLTMREYVIALEAFVTEEERKRDQIEWMTAHVMYACMAPWGKKSISPRKFLQEWKAARNVRGDEPTPLEAVRDRFLKELEAKNDGRPKHNSKI